MVRKTEKRQPRFLSYILKSIVDLGEKDGSSFNSILNHVQAKMREINHEVSKKMLVPHIQKAVKQGVKNDILRQVHGKFQLGSTNLKVLPLESAQLCTIFKRNKKAPGRKGIRTLGRRAAPRTHRRKHIDRRRRARPRRRRRRTKRYRSPTPASTDDDQHSASNKGSKTKVVPSSEENTKEKPMMTSPKSDRYIRQPKGRSPARPHKDKSGPPSKPQTDSYGTKFSNAAGRYMRYGSSSEVMSHRDSHSSYSSGYSDSDDE